MISCIMTLYDFFRIFIEFFIALIHCVSFFNFFLIIDDVRNSIRFFLKNYFNFIVLFLLFSVAFLTLFKSSMFVMFRNFFLSTSFSILNVIFFFSSLSCSLWSFFSSCFFLRFRFLLLLLLSLSHLRRFSL